MGQINGNNKLKIISSWEDGSIFDFKMADLMKKYKIPTTFYWPSLLESAKVTFDSSKKLTPKDCKKLAKKFEIGSHGATHQSLSKMTIAQLGHEITESRKALQDLTGQEINSFAYPKKSINSLTKALVKGAGYKSARSNVPTHLNAGDDPFEIKCTVQVGIDRLEYDNKSWELFWEEMAEKADENSVFHIFGSSWDVEQYNDWDHLETLLKKLKV